MARKNLDAIVANDVRDTSIGFGSDRNSGTLLLRDGTTVRLPEQDKGAFAAAIVEALIGMWGGGG